MKRLWTAFAIFGMLGTWGLRGQTNTFPSSGNAGIGTTIPAYPLDVSSTTVVALRLNGTNGITSSNNTQLRFAGGKSGELWTIGTDVAANSGSRDFHFYALPNAGNVVAMTLRATTGNVGIGTTSPEYPLSVNGTVQAKEVLVNTGWSDYVFAPNYHLRPLADVASYIKQNQHLPDMPSAAEVEKSGVSVGEMESKLLAKVEELTLHMIQAGERNDRLEQRNRELLERVERLESRLAETSKRPMEEPRL